MSLVGKIVGNYVVERLLGEGGMGEVYRARHPRIGKLVAIKVLKPELAKDADAVGRFFNEARAVNEIGHPGLVDVIDLGNAFGRVYYTMELLEGEDLATRMGREGLTLDESRQIIVQCCEALSACHQMGIIHRDLKPENIFLVPERRGRVKVKILDFGLAKLSRPGVVKTKTGAIFGTPLYSSPEQASGGSKDVTPAADVYSLGVLLYELFTGQVPFNGETTAAVLIGHMTQAPQPPSELNPHLMPELEAIVMTCLQKSPSARFASTEELAQALRDPSAFGARKAAVAVAARAPARAQVHAARTLQVRRSQPVPTRAPRFSRRTMRGALTGALVAVGASSLLLIAMTRSSRIPVAAPPVASVPAPNEIVISTHPANAIIWRGDDKLGATPYSLRLAATSTPFYVQLRKDGYEPKLLHIDPSSSRMLDVELQPDATATPPTTTATTAATGKSSRPSTHRPVAKKPTPGEDDLIEFR